MNDSSRNIDRAPRSSDVVVLDEVAAALDSKRPVVALESAVITHGLPREPASLPVDALIEGWSPASDSPLNLELGRAMTRTVRECGAVPATVAVLDGVLHLGLTDSELERLARDEDAAKASATNLAHLLATRRSAGATVSATLIACALEQLAHPIHVMATGGIGGAHRSWAQSADVSADLRLLAETQVCVVCSGAKSILDIPATLEMLTSLGVPVVGYQTDTLPQFFARGEDHAKLAMRLDSARDVARMCHAQWCTLRRPGGIVLAQSVPVRHALDSDEVRRAVLRAEEEASHAAVLGEALTPHLLQSIAAITAGRSVVANLSLLLGNARLASAVAAEFAVRAGR